MIVIVDAALTKSGTKLPVKLSLLRYLQLKLSGRAYAFSAPVFRGSLDFYVVRCREHGCFLDYPHGYRGYFSCPRCRDPSVAPTSFSGPGAALSSRLLPLILRFTIGLLESIPGPTGQSS
jgi:hypothetical protein